MAKAITNLLPNESIIYYGDTKHLPYGDKSISTIKRYSKGIAAYLLAQDCKCIVIACNSASAAAYDSLVQEYGDTIPIYNVVDPLVEEVVDVGYDNVGIIATKATIASKVYSDKLHSALNGIQVNSLATPLLAPMIEEGFYKNDISSSVIEEYLSHEKFSDIEAMLLACTHYPLIKDEVNNFFKNKVKVHDSTVVVANWIKEKMEINNMINQTATGGNHSFHFSDLTPAFEETAKMFYQESITLELVDIW